MGGGVVREPPFSLRIVIIFINIWPRSFTVVEAIGLPRFCSFPLLRWAAVFPKSPLYCRKHLEPFRTSLCVVWVQQCLLECVGPRKCSLFVAPLNANLVVVVPFSSSSNKGDDFYD